MKYGKGLLPAIPNMRFAYLLLLPLVALAQSPTEKLLLEKIAALEARIAALEGRQPVERAAVPAPSAPAQPAATNSATSSGAPETAASSPNPLPAGTTFNFTLDGYYAYNTNRPVTRTNELRAYDGSHNSISLNQATFVLERTTSLSDKRYLGGRIDLQFG